MVPIIHIVDDDRSFRVSIGRLVEASGYRAAIYESGDDILTRLSGSEPGCILLDLQMPGLNGLELQGRLAEKAPLLPILFLSGVGSIEATVRAMKAGAEDFLEKPVSREKLLEAIDRALLRYEEQRNSNAQVLTLQALVASLTPREYQVFALAVRGKRNKQIAFELGTSERTVKAHRRNVMEKLGVNSLAEAVS
ncbi:response regulator transcription factor, partial [Rhizobiaceae sp. 2RAB30]